LPSGPTVWISSASEPSPEPEDFPRFPRFASPGFASKETLAAAEMTPAFRTFRRFISDTIQNPPLIMIIEIQILQEAIQKKEEIKFYI
jgi:hypothetical protein